MTVKRMRRMYAANVSSSSEAKSTQSFDINRVVNLESECKLRIRRWEGTVCVYQNSNSNFNYRESVCVVTPVKTSVRQCQPICQAYLPV